MAEQAAALQSQANDVASSVAAAAETGELDPGELDAVNARLELIGELKRKYGGSIEGVLAHAEASRAATGAYEGRDRRIAELVAREDAARRDLETAAAHLTTMRKRSATALTKRVGGELGDLALGSGRFGVAFEPLDRIGPDGAERLEFQFSANAGEPLRPLARIASGGELSRMLLALVVALSHARDASTALVFDEIDAGVGGTTGAAVGARLGRLAGDGQVICVTHLAQLATWADRHYVLEKSERAGTTTISVREISGDAERETELARMLSGETHEAALKHARALLQDRRRARSAKG
jgi:DNA repair protein RecN (Recombination protein N)